MVGIRFCHEFDDDGDAGDDGDEDDDQVKSTSHQSRNDIDHVDDDNDDDDVGDDDGDVDDEDDGQATSNCHQARDDDDNAVRDDDEESLPKMFTTSRPQPKSPPQCLPPAHLHQTINNVIASIIGNASGGREIGLIRSEKNQKQIGRKAFLDVAGSDDGQGY